MFNDIYTISYQRVYRHFQQYGGEQSYWQRKLEYPENPLTDLKLLKHFITKSCFRYTHQHGLGINSHQSCV